MKQSMQPKPLKTLFRCLGFLKPYRRFVTGAYLALICINALALAIPQFVRWIVDTGIREKNTTIIGWSVLLLLGLAMVKGVFTFFQGRWSEKSSQGVAYDIRNAIHSKLSGLSFSYHDKTATGELLSRSIQDVDRIRFITGRALLHLLNAVVLLLGTTAVLLVMNPKLALLALCCMPILAYRSFAFGRRYRPLSRRIQEQLAVLTTRLEQNLQGSRVVKAFAQQAAEIKRFDKDNEAWFDVSAQSVRLTARNIPLLHLIANIGTVFVVWFGGRFVIQQEISLGEMVAFSTYLSQLIMPIRRFGMFIVGIAQAMASGNRVLEILDEQSEIEDSPDAAAMDKMEGHVRFRDVSFSYFHRHQVLSKISFQAKAGQIVALLGVTGSGKSSIINLIPRFYDPTEGCILIDEQDIRQIKMQSLRSQIGIVLQDTTLFATTIRENINFGSPVATEKEMVHAAKAAQAHDFILQMPEAYETQVGEKGHTLSGGQKQRIAIARALLSDPRILILDDATSSVDTETEHLIQQAMDTLMKGRTSFVIAQRLSTIRKADLILVLNKGKISASGTHGQLLDTNGIYADIYNRQLKSEADTKKGTME